MVRAKSLYEEACLNGFKFFEAWVQFINPLHGDTDGKAHDQVMTLSYPKDYKCTMSIAKFNKDSFKSGRGYVYYCFIRSWPLSVAPVPVGYGAGGMVKLNVTFRYERYVMENVTVGMIRSGWKGYSDSFDPWLGRYDDYDNLFDYTKSKEYASKKKKQDTTNVDSSVKNGGEVDNNLVSASNEAVEGGYTISKENLKTTGQLVRADEAQYGNTFPAGSF